MDVGASCLSFVRTAPSYLQEMVMRRLRRPSARRAITPTRRHLTERYWQEQSLLFALPAEIRHMIITYTLGNQTIGLAYKTKLTEDHDPLDETRPEWDNVIKRDRNLSKPDTVAPNFAALLRSCRRVYAEAIDILYTTNTLRFNEYAAPRDLWYVMSPHRRDQIGSIDLYLIATPYCIPGLNWRAVDKIRDILNDDKGDDDGQDIERYNMWRHLGRLKGLRELRLHVEFPHRGFPRDADSLGIWLDHNGIKLLVGWIRNTPTTRLQVFEVVCFSRDSLARPVLTVDVLARAHTGDVTHDGTSD